ncbi:MAG: ABC transporter ATP-binding protein, partial [Pirellulaceae bacterium]
LQAVSSTGNSWLLGTVSLQVVRGLRREIYVRLQSAPMSWFDRTSAGAIMTRIMDDVTVVQGVASGQTLVLLLDLSTAAAATAWVLSCSWRMGIVLGCAMVMYVVVFRVFGGRIQAGSREVRLRLDEVFSQLKQKIDGIQVVRTSGSEPLEIDSFTQQITALHRPRLRVNGLGIAFSHLCMGIGGLGASLVFAVGAAEVGAGRMMLGDLIAASALTGLIFTPVTRLSELATVYQQAVASCARLNEILAFPVVAQRSGEAASESDSGCGSDIPEGHISGHIVFRDVHFAYGEERPVLRGVTLTVEPGKKVAIVGPTGSGKSTLIQLLLRFYEPASGEIWLDGQPLRDLPVPRLRRSVGVVLQEAVVFRGTLADNIRYGAPTCGLAEVEAAARAARIDELAARLPAGYGTIVGEGGYPLSLGERQRIALARVFCKNPAVVVLDEATSCLDRASESAVQDALQQVLTGRTTLTIAHRLETVRGADQIVVLHEGQIVQTGSHAELFADRHGLYRQLCDCQFGPTADRPNGPGPRLPGPPSSAPTESPSTPLAA